VRRIDTASDASLAYEVADVKIWSSLGLHLAAKLRGAVALATYRATGDEALKHQAIRHLEAAVANWNLLAATARPIYRDMKLAHYNGNSFDANSDNLFHWARLSHEVAKDVATAVAATGP
jgi:hypothetical protein